MLLTRQPLDTSVDDKAAISFHVLPKCISRDVKIVFRRRWRMPVAMAAIDLKPDCPSVLPPPVVPFPRHLPSPCLIVFRLTAGQISVPQTNMAAARTGVNDDDDATGRGVACARQRQELGSSPRRRTLKGTSAEQK